MRHCFICFSHIVYLFTSVQVYIISFIFMSIFSTSYRLSDKNIVTLSSQENVGVYMFVSYVRLSRIKYHKHKCSWKDQTDHQHAHSFWYLTDMLLIWLYLQSPHGLPMRHSGSPKFAVKTRQAFYLQTTVLTRVARRLCQDIIRPRYLGRHPYIPVNTAAIKAECKQTLNLK